MQDKLKAFIGLELSELDKRLENFAKQNNLDDKAKVDLQSIVDARIFSIIHLIDGSEPFASIPRFFKD